MKLDLKDVLYVALFLNVAVDHFKREASDDTLDNASREAAGGFQVEAQRLAYLFEGVLSSDMPPHDADDLLSED